MSKNNSKRIGIYSGSFDPVHQGHISFALAALKEGNLDMVYFAPEVKPRRKPQVTHIAHRVQMLNLAVSDHPQLGVIELPSRYFLPKTTLPLLRQKFKDDSLILLLGSDLFERMHLWPHVNYLLNNSGLLVGVRGNYEVSQVLQYSLDLPTIPSELIVIDAIERDLSSNNIRKAFADNTIPEGISPNIYSYAKKNWLYVSISEKAT